MNFSPLNFFNLSFLLDNRNLLFFGLGHEILQWLLIFTEPFLKLVNFITVLIGLDLNNLMVLLIFLDEHDLQILVNFDQWVTLFDYPAKLFFNLINF